MIRPFKSGLEIRTDNLAILAVALAPIAYFLPALYRGDVLCPEDGMLFNVPLRVAAAQILKNGDLPLWNPYIFSGMPLLGAAQGGLLFPLNWYYLVFAPATATNLMVVSSYIVAGVGACLYARRIGGTVVGALFTGLVWQLGGCLIGQISHINIVHTAALLPWVFWSVESYAQNGGYLRACLISVLIAIQIFAGHQQTFAYSAILLTV